jgi:hypothetical protein
MENKKGGYNGVFWGLAVSGAALLVGSAYYIYNLINQEEEFNEEDMEQITKLKEEMSHNLQINNGVLTVDTACQIMVMTNKISEDLIKKAKPDLDDRRRAAINDPNEYEKICQENMEAKEWAYNEAMNKVFQEFGGITIEDITKVMQTVHPMEIEKLNHKYESFKFDEKPDVKLVKEAYVFYGKKFVSEMNEFQRIIANFYSQNPDPQAEQYLFFRMLTMKMKVDDQVFLRYKYTEPQIKFLLFEYNLMDDIEIKRVNEQLMKFDQMFAPQPMDQ